MFDFLKSWKPQPRDVGKELQTYLQTWKTRDEVEVGESVVFKEELTGLVECPAKHGVVMEVLEPQVERDHVGLGEYYNCRIATASTEGVYLTTVDSRMYQKGVCPDKGNPLISQVRDNFNNDQPITPDVVPGTFVRFRRGLLRHAIGFDKKIPEPNTPLIVMSSDKDSVVVAGWHFDPFTNHISVQTRKYYELCKLETL